MDDKATIIALADIISKLVPQEVHCPRCGALAAASGTGTVFEDCLCIPYICTCQVVAVTCSLAGERTGFVVTEMSLGQVTLFLTTMGIPDDDPRTARLAKHLRAQRRKMIYGQN